MNSNEQIKAPISLKDDVYHVLGISPSGAYYDLAEACTSDKINKWSKYKPIVPITDKYTPLTEEDIQARHCGLKPIELKYLWSSCSHIEPATYKDVRTINEIMSQIKEWEYVYRPTLANNNWFRLTDFSNASNPKGDYGYMHDALPSDKDWDGYKKTRDELDGIAWNNVNQDLADTNAYDFTVENGLLPLESFSINLDDHYGYIGNGNDKMLPLTDAAGSGVIENEYWRIAYAVQIPYHSTLDSTPTNEWYLFIGRSPLKDVTNTTLARQYFAPHMGSNTLAVQLMLANNRDKYVRNFPIIPCLVKNARLNKETTDGTNYRNWVSLDSSSVIYAMPSGAGTESLYFTIVTEEETFPQVGNVHGIVKNGEHEDAWILGTLVIPGESAGEYGPQVVAVVVVRKTPITGEHTVTVDMDYNYYNGTTEGGSASVAQTFTIEAGAEFNFSGDDNTYYGRIIPSNSTGGTVTGPGINFKASDVRTFNVDGQNA